MTGGVLNIGLDDEEQPSQCNACVMSLELGSHQAGSR